MWPLCKMSWLCRYFDIFCWFFFDNPLWDLCRQYSTCFRWKNEEISRGKWSRKFLRFLKNTSKKSKKYITIIAVTSWVRKCIWFHAGLIFTPPLYNQWHATVTCWLTSAISRFVRTVLAEFPSIIIRVNRHRTSSLWIFTIDN